MIPFKRGDVLRFGGLGFLSLALCMACRADEASAGAALSASPEVTATDAKLFGYAFGDGNFYTDVACSNLPNALTYKTKYHQLANDAILGACSENYDVSYSQSKDSTAENDTDVNSIVYTHIDCAKFNSFTDDAWRHIRITGPTGFPWPYCGDLSQFSVSQLKQFLSGLLPGEGNLHGKILDQTMNIPAGHYTTFEEMYHKLSEVQKALTRLGFDSTLSANNGDPQCQGHDSCQVLLQEGEGCRFTPQNGYSLVLYNRVPDAVVKPGGDPSNPADWIPGPCSSNQ